jgi:hypothetical protein
MLLAGCSRRSSNFSVGKTETGSNEGSSQINKARASLFETERFRDRLAYLNLVTFFGTDLFFLPRRFGTG